jgi:uncharacterized membrane protein
MDAMDYTPRAETIRLLAMASYLPIVPFVLLAQRRYRDIRLIRFHAYQAIGLLIWLGLTLLGGSIVSTLFGALPALGILINLGVGVLFTLGLLGSTVLGFYGAYQAYQGNYTSIPILTDWVWIQVNGSGRAQPPKRRRRKRPRPEAAWEPEDAPEEEEAP